MIHTTLPFFYPLLKLRFPSISADHVIVTYGQDIYSRQNLPKALVAHEMIHIRQQKNKLYGLWWWVKYLISADFRLSQELEAYRAQYQWVCNNEKHNKALWLASMAFDLCTYYELDITNSEARELIR